MRVNEYRHFLVDIQLNQNRGYLTRNNMHPECLITGKRMRFFQLPENDQAFGSLDFSEHGTAHPASPLPSDIFRHHIAKNQQLNECFD